MIFKGLSVPQNCLRPDSAPLIVAGTYKSKKKYNNNKKKKITECGLSCPHFLRVNFYKNWFFQNSSFCKCKHLESI